MCRPAHPVVCSGRLPNLNNEIPSARPVLQFVFRCAYSIRPCRLRIREYRENVKARRRRRQDRSRKGDRQANPTPRADIPSPQSRPQERQHAEADDEHVGRSHLKPGALDRQMKGGNNDGYGDESGVRASRWAPDEQPEDPNSTHDPEQSFERSHNLSHEWRPQERNRHSVLGCREMTLVSCGLAQQSRTHHDREQWGHKWTSAPQGRRWHCRRPVQSA